MSVHLVSFVVRSCSFGGSFGVHSGFIQVSFEVCSGFVRGLFGGLFEVWSGFIWVGSGSGCLCFFKLNDIK